MRILVMSDSHGREEYTYTVISENMDSDVIVHLGDGENDVDGTQLASAKIFKVRGNCDFFSSLNSALIESIGGYRFLMTHGHDFNVKQGIGGYLSYAKSHECNVALYGHTHVPFYEERDGVHLFNPGAVKDGRYGIIEIIGDKISFKHCEL